VSLSMNTLDSSTAPASSPPALEYQHPIDYRPIASFDPVPGMDHFFQQTAHRAISLAIWLLVGRVLLAAWPRNFDFTIYLLPVALCCLAIALPAAFLSATIARHRRQCERGQWRMVIVSLVLGLVVLGWMLIPKLVQVLRHALVHH
jgi:hypothetical protein